MQKYKKSEWKNRIIELTSIESIQEYSAYYKATYEPIREFFIEKENTFTTCIFYQGLSMIYGWMPTIPYSKDIKSKRTMKQIDQNALNLFQKAYSENILTKDEVSIIVPYVNRSVIGLSKMLHFINPKKYAIWDSRIAKVFGLRHQYEINNINNYILYLEAMHLVKKETGKNLRTVELLLFHSS